MICGTRATSCAVVLVHLLAFAAIGHGEQPRTATTVRLDDGSTYVGELSGGLPHGIGTRILPDGTEYKGGFRAGKAHGHGTILWPDGQRFEGEFVDGDRVENLKKQSAAPPSAPVDDRNRLDSILTEEIELLEVKAARLYKLPPALRERALRAMTSKARRELLAVEKRMKIAGEAFMNLRKMGDAATSFYGVHGRFPQTTSFTPRVPACAGAEPRAHKPVLETWTEAGWVELNFRPDDPFWYSYRFESSGVGPAAEFTAVAVGDLDCDGIRSIFEFAGRVGPGGRIVLDDHPSAWRRSE